MRSFVLYRLGVREAEQWKYSVHPPLSTPTLVICTSPHLTFSDHRHYEGWAQYCTRESYTLASTLSRMVNAVRGTALLLYLALVNLQSSLAAPTPALSTAVAEKKRATLGFSQKPVFSRHGDAFKARHARRDYDTQTRSIERRQADNDAPLYNLEDAR